MLSFLLKKSFLLSAISLIFIASVTISYRTYEGNEDRKIYEFVESNSDWLRVRNGVELSINDVVETYKIQLGLTPNDELVKSKVVFDDYGNTHTRFQHFHKQVKVEGSELMVHTKNNQVYLVNHTLVKNLHLPISIQISPEQAISKAIELVPAKTYMWESQWAEKLIKKLKKDPRATNFPTPILSFVSAKYDRNPANYQLAYDLTIHSLSPEKKQRIFLDASTGNTILNLQDIHEQSVKGIAETRYHGTKIITTDSVAPDKYKLFDSSRGNGIETYNALTLTNLQEAVDFEDEDNYWNNVNAQQDEVATDVHYGASSTFDYYLERFNRLGLNDTMAFVSFVHVDKDWTNATWNGMFARFGDGGGNDSPLTSLDVVGHEFAHGLTDFTADLVYMDEPGGLNESFSDIMGAALEFYADSATGDWFVGEDFIAAGGFRSMSEPNMFSDPDTYFGLNWKTGSGDNGGVHSNSGVQNYWFYLLSDGGEGVNDNGDQYKVEGISVDSAIIIAYGNLSNYLMVNSQYIDARIGGIQAATDIFGACSNEVVQTTNAWYAVGVGEVYARNDFQLVNILGPEEITCGVSNQEFLRVQVSYRDCNTNLPLGTKVPFYYSVNGGSLVYDTLITLVELFPNDTIDFTFSQPILEFSSPGNYEINVFVDFPNDNISSNNTFRKSYDRIYAQNVDLGITRITSPVSGCYLGKEALQIEFEFLGCDSIVGGETINLQMRLDGGAWVSYDYFLDSTLYRGDKIVAALEDSFDLSILKEYYVDAMIMYENDTIQHNNFYPDQLVDNPNALIFRVVMTFEGDEQAARDSFYTHLGAEVQMEIKDSVGFKDTRGIFITGNDGLNKIVDKRIVKPTKENIWNTNLDYKAQNCFCADLTMTETARVRFRINQSFSPIYKDIFGTDFEYASAARLKINENQIGPDIISFNTFNNPYLVKNIDISEYTGGQIEICFETSTLTSKENDPYGLGDFIKLDEIVLIADFTVADEEIDFSENINIYPNPAQNSIILTSQSINFENANFKMTSSNGQVFVPNVIANSLHKAVVDVNHFNSGIYFLSIESDEKLIIQKVIIQH